MENTKITPRDDYDYTAKLPDFWQVSSVIACVGLARALQFGMYRHLTRRQYVLVLGGSMVGAFFVAKAAAQYRDHLRYRRQLFVDDYIEKHPEDFMTPETKKYKDVLWGWNPHR